MHIALTSEDYGPRSGVLFSHQLKVGRTRSWGEVSGCVGQSEEKVKPGSRYKVFWNKLFY